MSGLPKSAPAPSGAPQSVRVQIYSHELLGNKDSQPLASFRLRASSSSTFADLAASVIDRYEKSHPGNRHKSEIGAVLDEKDCSFDMSDPIDIVQPNEFVRFILAKSENVSKSISTPKTVEHTRPGPGDQFVWSSAHSTADATLRHGGNVQDRTVYDAQNPQRPQSVTRHDSDLVEVDAAGTPIHPPKFQDADLDITDVKSMNMLSLSSQPTCSPSRPAVKSSAILKSQSSKRGKSVLQRLQDFSTERLSNAVKSGEDSSRPPVVTQPTSISAIAEATHPRCPSDDSVIEIPTRERPVQVIKDSSQGRRDPYEVPSDDSEIDDPPLHKSSVKVKSGSSIGSAKKQQTRASLDNTQLDTSKLAQITVPVTPAGRITNSIARAPSSLQKSPKSVPPYAKTSSLATPSNTDESRRRALEQIAGGAKTISLSDSQSQSDEVNEKPVGILSPSRPSMKAVGKRSHHSVNDHMDIVDLRQSNNPDNAPRPVMIRHSRGVVPVYRKGETPSSSTKGLKYPVISNSDLISRKPRQRTAQVEGEHRTQRTEATPPTRDSNTAKQPHSITKKSIPPETAIKHLKGKLKIKFGRKVTRPAIPVSFFAERKLSDDEYQSYSDDGDGLLDGSTGSEIEIKPSIRRLSTVSSQNGRGSRSLSQSSSPASVTPLNTLKSEGRREEPVQSPLRFHRGYPKRFREKFSDASDSSDLEDGKDGGNNTGAQPKYTVPRKPWWNPMDWIMRYETTFGSPNQEVANGPFKGYIPWGPRAGTYLPGYGPPNDEQLAEAEETAVLKDILYDLTSNASLPGSSYGDDSVSEPDNAGGDGQNVEDSRIPKRDDSDSPIPDNGLSSARAGQNDDDAKDPSRMVSERRSLLSLLEMQRERGSQSPELPDISLENMSLSHDKIAERAQRLDRTVQYVLTGTPTKKHVLPDTHGLRNVLDNTTQNLPSDLAPTTTPAVISSSPSGVSETTSFLIAQQLTQESGPPSNQELAFLLSSSPAQRSHQKKAAPAKVFTAPTDATHNCLSASSTESSDGIPAHRPPETPRVRSPALVSPRPAAIPEFEDQSPKADFIPNGIARRRSARIMRSESSAAKRNYRVTDIDEIVTTTKQPASGTPSKLTKTPAIMPKANETIVQGKGTDISVELPIMTPEKQSEYAVVSPEPSPAETLHPLKSFQEINGISTDVSTPQPRGASEEALEYVLRESPKWLNNITQIDPTPRSASGAVKKRGYSVSMVTSGEPSVANPNDDSLLQEQFSLTSTTLPVIPTLINETAPQEAYSSKRCAGTRGEIMPPPLKSLMSKDAERQHRKQENDRNEHVSEKGDYQEPNQKQETSSTAGVPANTSGLPENRNNDDGNMSSKRRTRMRKRKRHDSRQTMQPENRKEANIMTDIKSLDEGGIEDEGSPRKKRKQDHDGENEKAKGKHPQSRKEDLHLQPAQGITKTKKEKENEKAEAENHKEITEETDPTQPPPSPQSPQQQQRRRRQQQQEEHSSDSGSMEGPSHKQLPWREHRLRGAGGTTEEEHRSKTKTKNRGGAGAGAGDSGDGSTASLPNTRALAANPAGTKKNKNKNKKTRSRTRTRARARAIITPPTTSRPSSPESMRASAWN